MDEGTRKKINEMWTKYRDNKEVQLLLAEFVNLELKLVDADVMAMMIDIAIKRDRLDARSLIGDARLSYGKPWEFGFAKRDYLLRYQGGIEEVIEALSKDNKP